VGSGTRSSRGASVAHLCVQWQACTKQSAIPSLSVVVSDGHSPLDLLRALIDAPQSGFRRRRVARGGKTNCVLAVHHSRTGLYHLVLVLYLYS